MIDKLAGMVGLAVRAGKVSFGTEPTIKAVLAGRCTLVLIAEDAGENTCKVLQKLQCERLVRYTKYELGRMTGKTPKAVLGILDESFAGAVRKIFYGGGSHGENQNL